MKTNNDTDKTVFTGGVSTLPTNPVQNESCYMCPTNVINIDELILTGQVKLDASLVGDGLQGAWGRQSLADEHKDDKTYLSNVSKTKKEKRKDARRIRRQTTLPHGYF